MTTLHITKNPMYFGGNTARVYCLGYRESLRPCSETYPQNAMMLVYSKDFKIVFCKVPRSYVFHYVPVSLQ